MPIISIIYDHDEDYQQGIQRPLPKFDHLGGEFLATEYLDGLPWHTCDYWQVPQKVINLAPLMLSDNQDWYETDYATPEELAEDLKPVDKDYSMRDWLDKLGEKNEITH